MRIYVRKAYDDASKVDAIKALRLFFGVGLKGWNHFMDDVHWYSGNGYRDAVSTINEYKPYAKHGTFLTTEVWELAGSLNAAGYCVIIQWDNGNEILKKPYFWYVPDYVDNRWLNSIRGDAEHEPSEPAPAESTSVTEDELRQLLSRAWANGQDALAYDLTNVLSAYQGFRFD